MGKSTVKNLAFGACMLVLASLGTSRAQIEITYEDALDKRAMPPFPMPYRTVLAARMPSTISIWT